MGCFTSKENKSPDQFVSKEESQNEKLPEDVIGKELLEHNPILDLELLPDEVLEKIMTYLAFSDLFNLSKEGVRLEDCAMRELKKKTFSKYLFYFFITSLR